MRKTLPVILITLLSILFDQATKQFAITHLRRAPMTSFLADLFRLDYAENTGAFLSLGASLSPSLRFWLLTVVVGLMLIGFMLYLVLGPAMDRGRMLSFALILGGGVSNLLDRMFRTEGRVVDFMNMGIGPVRTGIFNFADVFIMAGLGWILLQSLRERDGLQHEGTAASAGTSAAARESTREAAGPRP